MRLFIIATSAFCIAAFAQGGLPTQPYLYVEGRAELEKPAELIRLLFSVTATDQEAGVANKLAQAKSTKVLALLDRSGVATADVVANDIASEAEYADKDGLPAERGTFRGYRVTRRFVVRVRDIPVFPKLVDELLETGVGSFEGIEEELNDPKAAESQVREHAVADARARAEQTAKAAGVKLGSVFAISSVPFPEISGKIFGGVYRDYPIAQLSPATLDPSRYRIAPVSLTQTVHVIFLLAKPTVSFGDSPP